MVGRDLIEAKQSKATNRSVVLCRTGAGLPLLAAGGTAGVLTIWNLEESKLHTVIKDAHSGPVCTLTFFAGSRPPLLYPTAIILCSALLAILGIVGHPAIVLHQADPTNGTTRPSHKSTQRLYQHFLAMF